MWLPFEEGILRLWMGGWLPTHWVGVEGGGFKNCDRWAACGATSQPGKNWFYCVRAGQLFCYSGGGAGVLLRLHKCSGPDFRVCTLVGVWWSDFWHCLSQATGGKVFSLGESVMSIPQPTTAASAPWRPSDAGAGNAPHKFFPKTMKFGGGSPPHPMGEVSHRARGVPDHQALTIGGMQHVQHWSCAFSVCAVCQRKRHRWGGSVKDMGVVLPSCFTQFADRPLVGNQPPAVTSQLRGTPGPWTWTVDVVG